MFAARLKNVVHITHAPASWQPLPMFPILIFRSLLPSWPPVTRKFISLSSSSLGTLDLLLLNPGELGTSPFSNSALVGPLNDPPLPLLFVFGVPYGVWFSSSESLLATETPDTVLVCES